MGNDDGAEAVPPPRSAPGRRLPIDLGAAPHLHLAFGVVFYIRFALGWRFVGVFSSPYALYVSAIEIPPSTESAFCLGIDASFDSLCSPLLFVLPETVTFAEPVVARLSKT